MKPVDVDPEDVGMHDTGSSQLSASTASNSPLPLLEMTDAEKSQNEEERKKRKAARKAKREARENKKNEQQKLEDKKQRKEERRLKREARKRREEAKKKNLKKQNQATLHQVKYQVALNMVMMMSPTKCPRVARRRARQRVATIISMQPYPTIILL